MMAQTYHFGSLRIGTAPRLNTHAPALGGTVTGSLWILLGDLAFSALD